MLGLFGKKKTTKQIVREQKRNVDRTIRQLERERASLERDEKKLIVDIKKMAEKNQMKSVQIMAKDLVRIRGHQQKMLNMCTQMRAISLQMTEVASTAQMTESMGKVTKSMMTLNRQLKLPAIQRIMMEFMKQSESMEMKQEMLTDAIDDAMEQEDDEEEQEAIVGQVLDEIGINLNENLVDAPQKQTEPTPVVADDKDQELEARLNNLKR